MSTIHRALVQHLLDERPGVNASLAPAQELSPALKFDIAQQDQSKIVIHHHAGPHSIIYVGRLKDSPEELFVNNFGTGAMLHDPGMLRSMVYHVDRACDLARKATELRDHLRWRLRLQRQVVMHRNSIQTMAPGICLIVAIDNSYNRVSLDLPTAVGWRYNGFEPLSCRVLFPEDPSDYDNCQLIGKVVAELYPAGDSE